MKKVLLRCVLAAMILVILSGCRQPSAPASGHTPQPSDTLYTAENAYSIYGYNPERALTIVDSAEIVGNLSDFAADLVRANIYARSLNALRCDTAYQIGEQLLKHDSVAGNPMMEIDVLEMMITAARMQQDNERCLSRSIQLSALLNTIGDKTGMLRCETEIGNMLAQQGQVDEGLAKIDSVITLLDNHRHFNELDTEINALRRKIIILQKCNRYDEALAATQKVVALLDHYEANPQAYADQCKNNPQTDAQRQSYINFFRAKIEAYMAENCVGLNKPAEALRHLAAYEQTELGQSYAGRLMVVTVYESLGEYQKVLAFYDEMDHHVGSDTLTADYAYSLKARAKVHAALGNTARALEYWSRYAHTEETVNNQFLTNKAHEYAARYHAQEQQQEIAQKEAIIREQKLIVASVVIIAILAAGFIYYLIRQNRKINAKNHALVQQIDEANEYRERYDKVYRELIEQTTHAAEKTEVDEEQLPLNKLTDEQLFLYLSNVIIGEQLYLDPLFGRQTLIDRFNISKNLVGAAFAKGSPYRSVAEYVRTLRLLHACQLLRNKPEMSINDVATASGFYSPKRFSTDFKNQYSLSPTEYREKSN